jgi:hypothetical protein
VTGAQLDGDEVSIERFLSASTLDDIVAAAQQRSGAESGKRVEVWMCPPRAYPFHHYALARTRVHNLDKKKSSEGLQQGMLTMVIACANQGEKGGCICVAKQVVFSNIGAAYKQAFGDNSGGGFEFTAAGKNPGAGRQKGTQDEEDRVFAWARAHIVW